jgi:putative transposase
MTHMVFHIRNGIANIISCSIAPKYRRGAFYGERRAEIGAVLQKLCEWKGAGIIEAEVCPDHIHMLIEIPAKTAVSSFMGCLKGKSSLMIYEKWGSAGYKHRNREFWCRYYVDTVGKDTEKIGAYIQNQLKEDAASDQLTMDDIGPFTGGKQQALRVCQTVHAPSGAAVSQGHGPHMKYPRHRCNFLTGAAPMTGDFYWRERWGARWGEPAEGGGLKK